MSDDYYDSDWGVFSKEAEHFIDNKILPAMPDFMLKHWVGKDEDMVEDCIDILVWAMSKELGENYQGKNVQEVADTVVRSNIKMWAFRKIQELDPKDINSEDELR